MSDVFKTVHFSYLGLSCDLRLRGLHKHRTSKNITVHIACGQQPETKVVCEKCKNESLEPVLGTEAPPQKKITHCKTEGCGALFEGNIATSLLCCGKVLTAEEVEKRPMVDGEFILSLSDEERAQLEALKLGSSEMRVIEILQSTELPGDYEREETFQALPESKTLVHYHHILQALQVDGNSVLVAVKFPKREYMALLRVHESKQTLVLTTLRAKQDISFEDVPACPVEIDRSKVAEISKLLRNARQAPDHSGEYLTGRTPYDLAFFRLADAKRDGGEVTIPKPALADEQMRALGDQIQSSFDELANEAKKRAKAEKKAAGQQELFTAEPAAASSLHDGDGAA